MIAEKILVADDEHNIRMALSQALESMNYQVDTAVNGEETLEKLQTEGIGLVLLDLKMPGMDGMEVLRQLAQTRPDVRVIIITAYGTIERAVEAMKLGVVDFIQKPFTPNQIRELVSKVMNRDRLERSKASDYESHIELAKHAITKRHLEAGLEHTRKAVAIDSLRPEGFNLMGMIEELLGNRAAALKNYRMAIEADPTYKPARENLDRVTSG